MQWPLWHAPAVHEDAANVRFEEPLSHTPVGPGGPGAAAVLVTLVHQAPLTERSTLLSRVLRRISPEAHLTESAVSEASSLQTLLASAR